MKTDFDYYLLDLVFEAADAMFRKLIKKQMEGYTGWNDPEIISDWDLEQSLRTNIDDQDWIDVMALAAMLNYRALQKPPARVPAFTSGDGDPVMAGDPVEKENGNQDIRIVSDGTGFGTRIIHIPSGKELTTVKRVTFDLSADGLAEAVVTLLHVPADLKGKLAPEEDTLPPGAVERDSRTSMADVVRELKEQNQLLRKLIPPEILVETGGSHEKTV